MNHGCVSNYTSDDAIVAISSLLLECALKSHVRPEEKNWYVPLYGLNCGGLYLIRFYVFLAVPCVIQRISSYLMIDNIDYFSIPVISCATMFKRINISSNRNYCEHWLMETEWRRESLRGEAVSNYFFVDTRSNTRQSQMPAIKESLNV